jgi:DNA invertase Pin-like site-specific DNA recombinase
MRIGYARVSTKAQNLDLQIDALTAAGCDRIYSEKISGENAHRPELDHCLKALRHGDTLVVWKLDRLGRSLNELIRIINSFPAMGVIFESLTEKIDTGSPTGQLIFHMFASLAEFERSLIQERVKAAQDAYRKSGQPFGRPKKLGKEKEKEAKKLVDAGLSKEKVAKILGVSRQTIYRTLKTSSNISN